jgi:hypothetical protein
MFIRLDAIQERIQLPDLPNADDEPDTGRTCTANRCGSIPVHDECSNRLTGEQIG